MNDSVVLHAESRDKQGRSKLKVRTQRDSIDKRGIGGATSCASTGAINMFTACRCSVACGFAAMHIPGGVRAKISTRFHALTCNCEAQICQLFVRKMRMYSS